MRTSLRTPLHELPPPGDPEIVLNLKFFVVGKPLMDYFGELVKGSAGFWFLPGGSRDGGVAGAEAGGSPQPLGRARGP